MKTPSNMELWKRVDHRLKSLIKFYQWLCWDRENNNPMAYIEHIHFAPFLFDLLAKNNVDINLAPEMVNSKNYIGVWMDCKKEINTQSIKDMNSKYCRITTKRKQIHLINLTQTKK
mgnify:CR=1 FL=1